MFFDGMKVLYFVAAMCWSSLSKAFEKSTVMQCIPSFSDLSSRVKISCCKVIRQSAVDCVGL